MTVNEALVLVSEGKNLSQSEAEQVMSSLMLGEVHHGVIGGFLVGMQLKGVTGEELCGFARGMQKLAVNFEFGIENLVDTCGTGGGRATFNLSTGAAILAAACGAKVAKHGNRAITSKCGSADVLEAMGVPIEGNYEDQKKRLETTGLVFLYAPSHHPAVRHVAPVRKVLGIRTFFNLIGPLSNPAGAKRQLVGIYDPRYLDTVAIALQNLGVEHAFVVHGKDGMDEVSPCSQTEYREVKPESIKSGIWSPEDFGINPINPDSLNHGADIDENAEILRQALSANGGERSLALIPNTAVTLVLSGIAKEIAEGADVARAALTAGTAADLLEKLCS